MVDRTGQPVEVRSAQSKFLLVTQPKRMISQIGRSVEERIAEERESSGAQIRTMLDEQRKTIIAEYCEKVSHHEFLAAQAEQNRRTLQEELLRQQQDFREVHQQDLMKMKELQKFQNSTFDEFTKQRFIEDQKIIMELCGRLQELQNEVNCMNDSKDFQDAESIRSGNSHVTSPPGLFPKHPPFEGMLRPSFISQRQTEEPPNIWDTSSISRSVRTETTTAISMSYADDAGVLSENSCVENHGRFASVTQQKLNVDKTKVWFTTETALQSVRELDLNGEQIDVANKLKSLGIQRRCARRSADAFVGHLCRFERKPAWLRVWLDRHVWFPCGKFVPQTGETGCGAVGHETQKQMS